MNFRYDNWKLIFLLKMMNGTFSFFYFFFFGCKKGKGKRKILMFTLIFQ